MPATFKTMNNLKPNAKSVSIAALNARVADSIDLALLTKQAHWNIKGPQFIALHEMIDGFRAEIDTHVDTMAERVVQLGGTAMGTTQVVANSVRAAIEETDDAGDKDTPDMLTAYSRALDKALWFLEAHTQ